MVSSCKKYGEFRGEFFKEMRWNAVEIFFFAFTTITAFLTKIHRIQLISYKISPTNLGLPSRMKLPTHDRYRPDWHVDIGQPNGPKYEYWQERTDRKVSTGFNEQSKICFLARQKRIKRPKSCHWPDRTDRNVGFGQNEKTELWVLARPNRATYGCWQEWTDRNVGFGQKEQTEMWVLARKNRPKCG